MARAGGWLGPAKLVKGWTANGSKLVRGLLRDGDPDGEGVLDELESVEE